MDSLKTDDKLVNEIYIELIARNESTINPFFICKCAIRDLDVIIPIPEIVRYLDKKENITPSKYNLTMKEIFN